MRINTLNPDGISNLSACLFQEYWSAPQAANSWAIAPWPQALWEWMPMRGHETFLGCWFIFCSLGRCARWFLHQYLMENEIGLSRNPDHHSIPRSFRHLATGKGVKTILLWSKNHPLWTQCKKKKKSVFAPSAFLGQEQSWNLCAFRHSSQARFQQFPSEIKSFWDESLFHNERKSLGLVCLSFFKLFKAFVGIPSGRRAPGHWRFTVVSGVVTRTRQFDPKGKILVVLMLIGPPNTPALDTLPLQSNPNE